MLYLAFSILAKLSSLTLILGSKDEMVEYSEQARFIVTSESEMVILDTFTSKNQIHFLVDKIMFQIGGEFDLRMSQLAKETHVSLVSADSKLSTWPPERLTIMTTTKVSHTDAASSIKGQLTKRDYYTSSHCIFGYKHPHCKGKHNLLHVLKPANCYTINDSKVVSVRIDNNFDYSIHIALYAERNCPRNRKRLYHWQGTNTSTCYKVKLGSSVWWDWPNHDSP